MITFKNIKNKFLNEINFPVQIIVIYMIAISSISIISIARNINNIKPFEVNSPDIIFVKYIFVLLLAILAIYKLLRYYYEFQSLGYLLIIIFIFGTMISQIFWQTMYEYIFNIPFTPFEGFLNAVLPELAFFRFSAFLGTLCFLIYAIRLRKWSRYSSYMKIILAIFILNNLTVIVFDLLSWSLFYFKIISMGDIELDSSIVFSYPFITLQRIILIMTNNNHNYAGIANTIYIAYYVFFYNVIKSKRVSQSKAMKITKYYWISLIGSIIFLHVSITFSPLAYNLFHNLESYTIAIFLMGLVVMLYFSPEVILLTDFMIFKAKKIYEVINTEDHLHSLAINQYTDYHARLKEYISQIPSEVRDEILR